MKSAILLLSVFLLSCAAPLQQAKNNVLDTSEHNKYSWKGSYTIENKLLNRIPTPEGFERKQVEKKSFADWLRNLPLKPGKPDVLLYNGEKKNRQDVHFAVLDIDVGNKDLQQCADAVIRLRAEYLFAQKNYDAIHYNFTNGWRFDYTKWKQGFRPKITNNLVELQKTTKADDSYESFKEYLQMVFNYSGTNSLSAELKPVAHVHDVKAGDVFIKGGFPGHAVLVLDVAENAKGEKVFLLAQSYMPAQDIHVLINPNSAELSPWYSEKFFEVLATPEWTFYNTDLKSWN
ncbi:MAG: DUF4846 domain-containing protein [Chitinophagales bacterium]